MKRILDRLRELINPNKRGEIARLARDSGVPYGTIKQWFYREAGISAESAGKISKALSVNPTWLLTGEGPKWDIPGAFPVPKMRRMIPLLNVVQAGRLGGEGTTPEDAYEPGDAAQWVPAYHEIQTSAGAFALTVEGDSMMPRIESGDVVIVEPELEPQTGDIVIAICPRTGEVRIKTYRKTAEDLVLLQSTNRDYEPIICKPGDDRDVVILGVVVEIRGYPRRK